MEEVRQYGPNVLSVEVVSGRRRWFIVGCYIAPDDAQTIERVVKALKDQPQGTALVVAGDLNTDLGDMDGDRRGAEISPRSVFRSPATTSAVPWGWSFRALTTRSIV